MNPEADKIHLFHTHCVKCLLLLPSSSFLTLPRDTRERRPEEGIEKAPTLCNKNQDSQTSLNINTPGWGAKRIMFCSKHPVLDTIPTQRFSLSRYAQSPKLYFLKLQRQLWRWAKTGSHRFKEQLENLHAYIVWNSSFHLVTGPEISTHCCSYILGEESSMKRIRVKSITNSFTP